MFDLVDLLLAATVPMTGALLLARVCFRRNPAARHAVLVAGLAGVWLMPAMLWATKRSPWPVVPVPKAIQSFVIVDHPMPQASPIQASPAEKIISAPVRRESISAARIETVVMAIWLIGVALLTARLLVSTFSAMTLCRGTKRVDFPGESAVFTSSQVSEPLCVGLIHPRVILPDALFGRLTAEELRAVIGHESAHALRRDHWIALAQRLAAAVFWPHPLVHLLGRQLMRAREESCDNHALCFMPVAEYARLLVRLSETLCPSSRAGWPVAAMSGVHFPLVKRIAGLLDPRRNTMTSAPRRSIIIIIVIVAIFTAIGGAARFGYAEPSQPALTPRQQEGKKTIDQLVSDISKALAATDSDAFNKAFEPALADDFTIQGYGGLATREQLIQLLHWKNPDEVHGPTTFSDLQLRFFGDAAIWTGQATEDEQVRGMPVHKVNRFTMVWADRNNKWQIVHLQVLPQETNSAMEMRFNASPPPSADPPLSRDEKTYNNPVKFMIDTNDLAGGDEIKINEIWGTDTELKPGYRYLVHGTYTLKSHDQAMLFAGVTATGGPTRSDPFQSVQIKKGSGDFTVAFQMPHNGGSPHLSLYQNGSSIGGVYFKGAR
jgi:beta-lactamase regulating signal transducer with metallopeptidase domain